MQCGKRVIHYKTLITSGIRTKEGDWPWHSAIWHTSNGHRSYACGGTLIASNAVLTAAHCVYDAGHPLVADRVVVQLGKQYLQLASPNTQEFRASRLIIHRHYNQNTFANDIALIRLATEATFTPYIQPICLWDDNRPALTEVVGRNGAVVGWGFNEEDELPEELHQAFMPVVDSIDCLESNPDFFGSLIRHSTFCAGFRNGRWPKIKISQKISRFCYFRHGRMQWRQRWRNVFSRKRLLHFAWHRFTDEGPWNAKLLRS